MDKSVSFQSLPPKYREIVQRLISNVITEWYFQDKKSGECADQLYEVFDLKDDPFTGLPVSDKQYSQNSIEYERQCFGDRYGEPLYYDWMGRDLI